MATSNSMNVKVALYFNAHWKMRRRSPTTRLRHTSITAAAGKVRKIHVIRQQLALAAQMALLQTERVGKGGVCQMAGERLTFRFTNMLTGGPSNTSEADWDLFDRHQRP